MKYKINNIIHKGGRLYVLTINIEIKKSKIYSKKENQVFSNACFGPWIIGLF